MNGNTPVFSFGSNSTRQLRARTGNFELRAVSGVAEGYERVFCLQSSAWKNGGVASIAPSHVEGSAVHGSIVFMPEKDLATLDRFEAGYRQERIPITVEGGVIDAVTYIAKSEDPSVWTPPLGARPSEMYLSAIRCHLSEHWGPDVWSKLAIRSYLGPGSVKTVYTWQYPGTDGLGLEALMVEVNFHKNRDAWVDGRETGRFDQLAAAEKLRAVGIENPPELRKALFTPGVLTTRLRSRDKKAFKQNTLDAMRIVLGLEVSPK